MKIRSERGAALIEYGILTGLVAVVAIGSVSQLGGKVESTFSMAASALTTSEQVVEQEVQVETTPEPTGLAASSFTITPTADSLNRGYVGYGSNQVGTLDEYNGLYPTIYQMSYYTTGSKFVLRVGGNFSAEFPGHTLTCDDGLSLNLSDATNISPESPDRTRVVWSAGANPEQYFKVGAPVSCRVSDS